MPSTYLILCRPLLIQPPIPPSIRVFSNESTLHIRWPKYWSFSFSISPSNAHPGLISFRMDWLALLAVQGTLKSLLQHHFTVLKLPRFLGSLTQFDFSSYQLFLHLGPYYPVHLIKILWCSACVLSTEGVPSGWALEGRSPESGTDPETERG